MRKFLRNFESWENNRWRLLNIYFYPKNIKLKKSLTPAGKVTNKLSTFISPKIAERSKAKSAKRSFTSKNNKSNFQLRAFSFASFLLSNFEQNYLDNSVVILSARVNELIFYNCFGFGLKRFLELESLLSGSLFFCFQNKQIIKIQ